MARLMTILAALLLLMGGFTYYKWYYPPSLLRRATQDALDDFAATIDTKDRARIGEMLKNRLTDGSKIHLEVTFFSFSQGNSRPEVQDFSKSTFIPFVDNTLYALTDYSFHGELQDFRLSPDRKSADVTFIADAWGDGNNYYAGTAVNSRFVTNTVCEGQVAFENKRALFDQMNCKMCFRAAPKAGEERKLQNPEALRQMLK